MPRFAGDVPLGLRVGLGKLVEEGRPLPAEWALAWGLTRFAGTLRTPFYRCEEEFHALFKHYYHQQYGEGLLVKPGKSRLSLSYRPGSKTFYGEITFKHPTMPDVMRKEPPTEVWRSIAQRCSEELDAYSRYLGRHSDAAGTPAALALLPPALATQRPPALAALLALIDEGLSSAPFAPLAGSVLTAAWPGASDGKMTKADSVGAVQALALWGIGIEPDPRFGGAAYDAGGQLIAFRLKPGSPVTPSAEHATASTILAVGAAMAASDGNVADGERELLLSFAQRSAGCTAAECERLAAHAHAMLITPPTFASLKKRLGSLHELQRKEVWDFLLQLVLADGVIDKAEVKLLTRLAPLLGHEADAAFDALHTAAAGGPAAPSPQETRSKLTGNAAFSSLSSPDEMVLDPAMIQAKLAESVAVSNLLGQVFQDEDDVKPAVAESQEEHDVKGLDVKHGVLLRLLAGRDTIDRIELEALAATLGLMPDGAIDTLNEAALDAFDAPIAEGDDPIALDRALIQELLL